MQAIDHPAPRPAAPPGSATAWVAVREPTFLTFYSKYYEQAFRLALHLLGDEQSAADIASEALVAVYGRRRRVTDVLPYLRRTVVNRCNSVFRRQAVERRILRGSAIDDLSLSSPEQAVVDTDAVRRALGVLPPRQRSAVILRYYADFSEEQTAAVLGCAVGTVKSQVYRAVARLRVLLERQD